MKLAIVGSRGFEQKNCLNLYVTALHLTNGPITEVVSGGAKGADSLGAEWAKENNIPTKIFIPDWDNHGKAAGYLRNIDIVENADMVLAFWDGKSKGTLHSINLAKEKGKHLIVVHYDEKGSYTEEYMGGRRI